MARRRALGLASGMVPAAERIPHVPGHVSGMVPAAERIPKRPGPVRRTLQRLVVQVGYLVSCVLGDDIVGRLARVFLLRVMGADLARGVTIHGGTYVSRPTHLVMGAGSFLNRNCYLDLEARLVMGAGVTVGHGTTFVTTRHEIGPHERRCGGRSGASITVGDGAWLGANVTVLSGIDIGSGAVVAAGAVVCEDVPVDALVAGIPARVRRMLDPRASRSAPATVRQR
jgi:maltose O-acetyltransferase